MEYLGQKKVVIILEITWIMEARSNHHLASYLSELYPPLSWVFLVLPKSLEISRANENERI